MHHYSLKSHGDPSIEIFAGQFLTLNQAVEAAIKDNVSLEGVDLSGAKLAGTDLSHGTFVGACLRGANLSQTRLDNADFSGADLSAAHLSWSTGHNFEAAGARFTDAEIDECHFVKCDLSGADLCVASARFGVILDGQMAGARFSPLLLQADLSYTRLTDSVLCEHGVEIAHQVTRPKAYLRVSGSTGLPISQIVTGGGAFVAFNNSSDTLPEDMRLLRVKMRGPRTPPPRRFLVTSLEHFLQVVGEPARLGLSTAEALAVANLLQTHAAGAGTGGR